MPNDPITHVVYRSMNKPLTIMGAERKLFFLAAVMGAATFTFFGSFIGGLIMFGALYLAARWATAHDPQCLRVLLNSARFRAYYDPSKSEQPC